MYRNIFFFLLIAFTFSAYSQNNSFILKGSFSDSAVRNSEKVYLQKLDSHRVNLVNLDSTIVDNGRFTFEKTITDDLPSMLFISSNNVGETGKKVMFMPENGEITMSIGESSVVGGTPKNEEIQALLNLQNSLSQQLTQITEKYSGMVQSSQNEKKQLSEVELIIDKMRQAISGFAKSNIKNDVGEYILLTSYNILPPEQILELLHQTRPQFLESDLGQEALSYYESMIIRNGRGTYKDITLQNPKGENISLSDYIGKNKVVLIDFWASWCGPCIREMPTIVAAYAKYKDKGFEIVGISLDEDKKSWQSAIERFKIAWPQMSDLKGWNSQAVQLYAVNSIPYTLLVDQKGNVIASFLYGEELQEKLKELLD